MEDLQTDRPHPSCHPSRIPTPVSWWLVRHFVLKPMLECELDAAQFPETVSTSLLDESCGGSVEDETLPKLVANSRTTRGTKLSVLQMIDFPSLVNRGF